MVDEYGFYLPNNHQIADDEIKIITNLINKVIC